MDKKMDKKLITFETKANILFIKMLVKSKTFFDKTNIQ